jgi:hypothetical protein
MRMPAKRSTKKRAQEQHACAATDSDMPGYRDGAAWLAVFLTNDAHLADACIVDTLTDASTLVEGYADGADGLLRQNIIHSAAQMMRPRISQLAPTYSQHLCRARHPPLSEQMLHVLVTYSDEIRCDLNTLCRFVLVLYGIEGYSEPDCARLLGVPPKVVEAAYCAALEVLELYSFESLMDEADNMYANS